MYVDHLVRQDSFSPEHHDQRLGNVRIVIPHYVQLVISLAAVALMKILANVYLAHQILLLAGSGLQTITPAVSPNALPAVQVVH